MCPLPLLPTVPISTLTVAGRTCTCPVVSGVPESLWGMRGGRSDSPVPCKVFLLDFNCPLSRDQRPALPVLIGPHTLFIWRMRKYHFRGRAVKQNMFYLASVSLEYEDGWEEMPLLHLSGITLEGFSFWHVKSSVLVRWIRSGKVSGPLSNLDLCPGYCADKPLCNCLPSCPLQIHRLLL